MDEPLKTSKQIQDNLGVISHARIFFGHQSVGNDIIAGIGDYQNDSAGRKINIIELDNSPELPDAFLLHSKVGKNTDPNSKCDDFKHVIDSRLAGKIDYALLKFCYIDIDSHSDVEAIFGHYRRTLDALISAHPDITFIHVTAPLRHSQKGPGVWIRELLGRPNRSKLDNIKRNEFNDMLRAAYPEDPVFDLAASESTYPDGRRETFKYQGGTYFGMIGEYTHDGGHLNEHGRRHVAADLANMLAALIRTRTAP